MFNGKICCLLQRHFEITLFGAVIMLMWNCDSLSSCQNLTPACAQLRNNDAVVPSYCSGKFLMGLRFSDTLELISVWWTNFNNLSLICVVIQRHCGAASLAKNAKTKMWPDRLKQLHPRAFGVNKSLDYKFLKEDETSLDRHGCKLHVKWCPQP